MARNRPDFERFVRRVHRRHVALNLLERAGLGVLAGCAAALPLVGIVLWQGMPAWQLTIVALAIGTVAGLLWGVITRPTLFTAAMEADRQLDWADLLSSALTVHARSSIDPWASAVTAAADVRCRNASPSSVLLNRLGARTWGGIGLATALVLVLGLMPAYSSSLRAGQAGMSLPLDTSESRHTSGSGVFSRRTPDQAEPDETRANRTPGDMTPPDRSGQDAQNPDAGPHSPKASGSAARGSGQSQSKSLNPSALEQAQGASRNVDRSTQGRAAGGIGAPAASPASDGGSSGQIAGSAHLGHPVAPWQSKDWPTDLKQARQAIQSGQVPDAYLDLVRGYFERP